MSYFNFPHFWASKKIRFVIVGAWNTLFAYLAFLIIYSIFSDYNIHYIFALCASQVVGLTNAFVCHRSFVYKSRGNVVTEYLRYYLVYGFSLLINIFFLGVLVEYLNFNPIYSQLGIAAAVAFLSYVGHDLYTFKWRPK